MGEINQDFIDKDGFHYAELSGDYCPKCHSPNIDGAAKFPGVFVCKDCGLDFEVANVAIWKDLPPKAPKPAEPMEPIISLSEVEEGDKP